jgi:hypothetical protein
MLGFLVNIIRKCISAARLDAATADRETHCRSPKPTTKTPLYCSVMHSGAPTADFDGPLGADLQVVEFKRIKKFDFW